MWGSSVERGSRDEEPIVVRVHPNGNTNMRSSGNTHTYMSLCVIIHVRIHVISVSCFFGVELQKQLWIGAVRLAMSPAEASQLIWVSHQEHPSDQQNLFLPLTPVLEIQGAFCGEEGVGLWESWIREGVWWEVLGTSCFHIFLIDHFYIIYK